MKKLFFGILLFICTVASAQTKPDTLVNGKTFDSEFIMVDSQYTATKVMDTVKATFLVTFVANGAASAYLGFIIRQKYVNWGGDLPVLPVPTQYPYFWVIKGNLNSTKKPFTATTIVWRTVMP